MNELPPFLGRLFAEQRLSLSQLSDRGRKQLRALFDGGVLSIESAGRGQVVLVRKPEGLVAWLRQNFPAFESQWLVEKTTGRAHSVALRRSSKATGSGAGAGVLHLRGFAAQGGAVALDSTAFPVSELTTRHGVAACLIGPQSILSIEGRSALIENLECFLQVEFILPEIAVAMNSAGRISDQLVACLARSSITPEPLLHLPDYDPVGLSDYLRLRSALGERVALFVPSDIERLFSALGDRKLISEKPRNRVLLRQLATRAWPCRESETIFQLIKESGSGLEQESLLLKFNA
jgi:hypothetical protein